MTNHTEVSFVPGTLTNDRKLIRDALNIADIEGAQPQKLKERSKLYNAIDYNDVNGSKKKFVIIKGEVNFDGKGERRGGSNETIEERAKKLKGFNRKGSEFKTYKGNSADNSKIEESEESYKEKTVKVLKTDKLVKNNSDFGRRKETNKYKRTDKNKEREPEVTKKTDKEINKDKSTKFDRERKTEANKVKKYSEHTKKEPVKEVKQKENISKRANKEVKRSKKEEKSMAKEKMWEVYEGVSDDDVEEISYHKKHSNHQEDNTKKDNTKKDSSKKDKNRNKGSKNKRQEDYESDDGLEECDVQESEEYERGEQESDEQESKEQKSEEYESEGQENEDQESEEQENEEQESERDNDSRKVVNSRNKTSKKYYRKRSEEVSENDSYDEGQIKEVNKKSILDKFIFFGKDSQEFFSSKIPNTNQSEQLNNISEDYIIKDSKKPHVPNHKQSSNDYSLEKKRNAFKQDKTQLKDEQIMKHTFLKKGSPKAIPFSRTGFKEQTRSQEKLGGTKKTERTSSPRFSYYPKTIVSKPLMRRCGGNIKLVYY